MAIGVSDKLNLILEQGGKCAVPDCGEAIDITDAVDHCHQSGQVRAVLCHPCNVSLGLLKENPRRMEGLARYARGWKQLRLAPVGAVTKKP